MKEMMTSAVRGTASAVSRGSGLTGAVVGGMRALSAAAGPMAQWGGRGNFGANALSLANAAGGKAMSMLDKAVIAGTREAMYRNPVYRGYQDAISLLGNKSNGLLVNDTDGKSRASANGSGVTPQEMLDGLNNGAASTVSQKISDLVNREREQ